MSDISKASLQASNLQEDNIKVQNRKDNNNKRVFELAVEMAIREQGLQAAYLSLAKEQEGRVSAKPTSASVTPVATLKPEPKKTGAQAYKPATLSDVGSYERLIQNACNKIQDKQVKSLVKQFFQGLVKEDAIPAIPSKPASRKPQPAPSGKKEAHSVSPAPQVPRREQQAFEAYQEFSSHARLSDVLEQYQLWSLAQQFTELSVKDPDSPLSPEQKMEACKCIADITVEIIRQGGKTISRFALFGQGACAGRQWSWSDEKVSAPAQSFDSNY